MLEPVRGYLLLGARLAGREGWQYASAWNFGPSMENAVPVRTLVAKLDAAWRVYSLPDRRMIVSKSWSGSEPLRKDGYDEMAAAESRLLARLASEIAATLR